MSAVYLLLWPVCGPSSKYNQPVSTGERKVWTENGGWGWSLFLSCFLTVVLREANRSHPHKKTCHGIPDLIYFSNLCMSAPAQHHHHTIAVSIITIPLGTRVCGCAQGKGHWAVLIIACDGAYPTRKNGSLYSCSTHGWRALLHCVAMKMQGQDHHHHHHHRLLYVRAPP